MFNIVKCGETYLNLEDIPETEYRCYCFENDECVKKYLKEIGADALIQDEEFLKKRFNPLLIKQNLYLMTRDLCYEIPWLLLKHREHFSEISKHVGNIENAVLKNIFVNLLKYTFTKDLGYLNALIAEGAEFTLFAFPYLNKAISVQKLDVGNLKMAIRCVESGYSTEKTQAYGEYMRRKENSDVICLELFNKIKGCTKKKNIVLVHLESISKELYYNKLTDFPVLNELMNNSLILNNYFSSATTSTTALIDLFFGNDFESDSFPIYPKVNLKDTYQRNMYEILQENGYDVLGLGYQTMIAEELNPFGIWPVKDQEYEWKHTYKEFIDRLRNFIMSTEKPFALHLWNLMPQLGHSDEDKCKGSTYLERAAIGCVSLDMTVKALLDILNEKQVMEDTVIICYGDHGDDKWTRSLNKGLTHITTPHLNVINCPASIYDSRIGKGIFNNLVGTVDLKNTALFLAGIENNEDFTYQGINIFEGRNKFVYSRNLLTNQRLESTIMSDWVMRLNNFSDKEIKNKSFGVINDNYNMLVSDHGLEFFMHKGDPGSYNNLLDFFELDESGKIVRFNNHGAWRGHLRLVLMADDQIYDIMKNYYYLRKALIERVTVKYDMIKNDEKNMIDMSLFNRARPREYFWD